MKATRPPEVQALVDQLHQIARRQGLDLAIVDECIHRISAWNRVALLAGQAPPTLETIRAVREAARERRVA